MKSRRGLTNVVDCLLVQFLSEKLLFCLRKGNTSRHASLLAFGTRLQLARLTFTLAWIVRMWSDFYYVRSALLISSPVSHAIAELDTEMQFFALTKTKQLGGSEVQGESATFLSHPSGCTNERTDERERERESWPEHANEGGLR